MRCKECIHCDVCIGIQELFGGCKAFKPQSKCIVIPDDEVIIYTKDNWLMINMESKDLGRAMKQSVDYLTKNAKERAKG